MKQCPLCKYVNFDTNFCFRDGTRLVEVAVCECGRKLSAEDRFCENCGKAVPETKDGKTDNLPR